MYDIFLCIYSSESEVFTLAVLYCFLLFFKIAFLTFTWLLFFSIQNHEYDRSNNYFKPRAVPYQKQNRSSCIVKNHELYHKNIEALVFDRELYRFLTK